MEACVILQAILHAAPLWIPVLLATVAYATWELR